VVRRHNTIVYYLILVGKDSAAPRIPYLIINFDQKRDCSYKNAVFLLFFLHNLHSVVEL
jgi:hypothetical protein